MRGRPIVDEVIGRPAALADPTQRSADGDEPWWLASGSGGEDAHLGARPDPAVVTVRLRDEPLP